jgi:hypothetical protein
MISRHSGTANPLDNRLRDILQMNNGGTLIKYVASWSIVAVVASLSFLACGVARADWAVAGAQYTCQADNRIFEILPYIGYSSSADPPENAPLKSGFKKVSSKLPIVCGLGGHVLRTVVEIIEPYDANGMGAGRVDITSMSIGTVKLVTRTEYLAWDSERKEDRLVRIHVHSEERSVSIERCYGEVTPSNEPKIDHCDTRNFDISL